MFIFSAACPFLPVVVGEREWSCENEPQVYVRTCLNILWFLTTPHHCHQPKEQTIEEERRGIGNPNPSTALEPHRQQLHPWMFWVSRRLFLAARRERHREVIVVCEKESKSERKERQSFASPLAQLHYAQNLKTKDEWSNRSEIGNAGLCISAKKGSEERKQKWERQRGSVYFRIYFDFLNRVFV